MMNDTKYLLLKQQLVMRQVQYYERSVTINDGPISANVVERMILALCESIVKDFVIPAGVLDSGKCRNALQDLLEALERVDNNRGHTAVDPDFKPADINALIYNYPEFAKFMDILSKSPIREELPDSDILVGKVDNMVAQLIRHIQLFAQGHELKSEVPISTLLVMVNLIQLVECYYNHINMTEGK